MSHIMKPPEPKCPHFPLLHHPIAARTTTATTAEVKNTRHKSWLFHLQSQIQNSHMQFSQVNNTTQAKELYTLKPIEK